MTAVAAADAATNGVTAVESAVTVEETVATPATTPATTPADSTGAAAPATTVDQTSVTEGRRLYLGNVAYAATEEVLTEFFTGFDVQSVSIPKNPHTKKSVGYAFVDVATPEEAQRAISELDRKVVLERKVSVQIARPPVEAGENADGTRANGRARRRAAGKKSTPAAAATATEGAEATEGTQATEGAEAAPAKAKTAKNSSPKRKTVHKGPPTDGVQSKVKVMVTNLPYNLTEEALKDLFAEFNPVSAKVALRPIPTYMIKKLQARGEARKGRGFGFVTLENEEQQLAAIAKMNNFDVEGRNIEVKVAIDSPDKVERTGDDAKKSEEVETEAVAPAVEAATAAAA